MLTAHTVLHSSRHCWAFLDVSLVSELSVGQDAPHRSPSSLGPLEEARSEATKAQPWPSSYSPLQLLHPSGLSLLCGVKMFLTSSDCKWLEPTVSWKTQTGKCDV